MRVLVILIAFALNDKSIFIFGLQVYMSSKTDKIMDLQPAEATNEERTLECIASINAQLNSCYQDTIIPLAVKCKVHLQSRWYDEEYQLKVIVI